MKHNRLIKAVAAVAEMTMVISTEPVTHAASVARTDDTAHAHAGSAPPYQILRGRLFEMFRLLGKGRSVAQIACYFTLAPKAVGRHLDAIQSLLGCRSRTELSRLATGWMRGQSLG